MSQSNTKQPKTSKKVNTKRTKNKPKRPKGKPKTSQNDAKQAKAT